MPEGMTDMLNNVHRFEVIKPERFNELTDPIKIEMITDVLADYNVNELPFETLVKLVERYSIHNETNFSITYNQYDFRWIVIYGSSAYTDSNLPEALWKAFKEG